MRGMVSALVGGGRAFVEISRGDVTANRVCPVFPRKRREGRSGRHFMRSGTRPATRPAARDGYAPGRTKERKGERAGADRGNCGDRDAARSDWFCAEILPHGPWLERWIAHRFPRETDLADIVQESFEHILGRADPPSVQNARAYLRRTAHTLLLMRIRRRRVVHIDYRDSLDGLGLACAYPLPDEQLCAREELARAATALAALPDRTRDVVRLRRWDGASQRETAAALGITESCIEKHMCRATRTMRAAIEAGRADDAGEPLLAPGEAAPTVAEA